MRELGRTPSIIRENKELTYRLKDLARLLDGKPHARTVLNWCRKKTKTRSVLMESIRTPAGLVSSLEAYHRFIQEFNQ